MGNNVRDNVGCSCRGGAYVGTRRTGEHRYVPQANAFPWLQRQGGSSCGCARPVREDVRMGDCGCAHPMREDVRSGGCGCSGNGEGCNHLMRQLQQLDFCIQETVLYLDAYPQCCEALAHYRELVSQREQVAKQYEMACGPLTNMGNGESKEWMWVHAPWPWYVEHPGNKG